MNKFHLRILAADRMFYDGECISLVVPTIDGYYGVLANHQNMIATIVAGTISYKTDEITEELASVPEGIIKIEDNDVLILTDTAEHPDEIDENRAKQDAEEAKEAILQKRSINEYREAEARLARALTRLKTKGKIHR